MDDALVINGGIQIADESAIGSAIESVTTAATAAAASRTKLVSAGVISTGLTVATGSYDILYVLNGGVAKNTTVGAGGTVEVYAGGIVSSSYIYGSKSIINVSNGALASRTSVGSRGTEYVMGMASRTSVGSGGSQVIARGGSAADTIVQDGGFQIAFAGGTVEDTTIANGASLYLYYGAAITGDISLTGQIFAEDSITATDCSIKIDLTQQTPGADARIDHLSGLSGVTLSLKVSETQTAGTYILAGDAGSFAGSITVYNSADQKIGSYAAGESFSINTYNYSLNLTNSQLALTVTQTPVTTSTIPDFNLDGKADVLLYQKYTGTAGAWMDAVSADWRAMGTVDTNDWTIAGYGDFNADSATDVLVYQTEYRTLGYWSGGDSNTWTTLGSWGKKADTEDTRDQETDLDDWEYQLSGDFNGNGKSDVLWLNKGSREVQLWNNGNQSSATTVCNYLSENWDIAGTGDFNGDGIEDILLQDSETGMVGYWGGASESNWTLFAEPGTDWDVVGVADLDGNGTDDILVNNSSAGTLGVWMNGSNTEWKTLSNLFTRYSSWSIAATGDYDGDGSDDILLRNSSSQTIGYWSAGDDTKWIGVADNINSNWTIIA